MRRSKRGFTQNQGKIVPQLPRLLTAIEWKKLFYTILVILLGNSCNPELKPDPNLTLEEASKIVGIELYVLKEKEWEKYNDGLPNLEEGQYLVYDCNWNKSPREWVIYKKGKNKNDYWFRFEKEKPIFSTEYFDDNKTVEEIIGIELSVIDNKWNKCDFILNLSGSYCYKIIYRHESPGDWIILKKESNDGDYYWTRFSKDLLYDYTTLKNVSDKTGIKLEDELEDENKWTDHSPIQNLEDGHYLVCK
jgi:hypothetical protein